MADHSDTSESSDSSEATSTDADPSDSTSGGDGTHIDCENVGEQAGRRQLRPLTRREYRNTLHDLLGLPLEQIDADRLPASPVSHTSGFDNHAEESVLSTRHIELTLGLAADMARQAIQVNRGAIVPCDLHQPDCPQQFVEHFGLRAFRRPLTPDEVARYTALFDPALNGQSTDEAAILVVRAMLSSPNFIYRSEIGEVGTNDGSYRLTGYEIASALSYGLWGTTPDEALLRAAGSGALDTDEGIRESALRLLANERARPQFSEFVQQWLATQSIASANKDQQIYPHFNDHVRRSMLDEQDRFVEHVAFDASGRFSELFTADYVFVDRALADYYGITGAGDHIEKMELRSDASRGGILTLASFLASHAHANDTSPVRRGVVVRERLLCQDLAPPPEDLDTTPPGLDPSKSTRERFAQHSADPACAGCHRYIDPLGFGFEGFDGVGHQRDHENGLPIDESGTLHGPEGLNDKQAYDFNGPREFGQLLANSSAARDCFVRQYYRFTLGYREQQSDQCSLERAMQSFSTADQNIQALMLELPTLYSWTHRQNEH